MEPNENNNEELLNAMPLEEVFSFAFRKMQERVHQIAVDHGWFDKEINNGEKIALMHSELSEALEGFRQGNPNSEKIGNKGFSQAEEEFADTIIRIMDFSQAIGLDIGNALIAKSLYNESRPYRHGNKNF